VHGTSMVHTMLIHVASTRVKRPEVDKLVVMGDQERLLKQIKKSVWYWVGLVVSDKQS